MVTMQLLEIATNCQSGQVAFSHEPFCLELFRRAIEEDDQVAWLYVHEQYFRLVYYWISQMELPDGIFIEDLVQDAFFAFWRAYTPQKLDRARGLGSVLSYLKNCAVSQVIQARRTAKKRRREDIGWELWEIQEETERYFPDGKRVWRQIVERCQNEQEMLIAQLIYLSGLKPRQILLRYPDKFMNINEVYRLQRNLAGRLHRDPILNLMCKNMGREH